MHESGPSSELQDRASAARELLMDARRLKQQYEWVEVPLGARRCCTQLHKNAEGTFDIVAESETHFLLMDWREDGDYGCMIARKDMCFELPPEHEKDQSSIRIIAIGTLAILVSLGVGISKKVSEGPSGFKKTQPISSKPW